MPGDIFNLTYVQGSCYSLSSFMENNIFVPPVLSTYNFDKTHILGVYLVQVRNSKSTYSGTILYVLCTKQIFRFLFCESI